MQKESPLRGFLVMLVCDSGRGGVIHRRLGVAGVAAVAQDRFRVVGATAAIGRNAQVLSELIEVVHTGLRGSADLLVGNGVADTDVHKFNNLAQFWRFKRKCE